MGKKESDKLFEQLMHTLSDGEWQTIEEIADEISLTEDTLKDFLIHLENAGVLIVEGNQYNKNNLVKGTDFVKRYLELPVEEAS